MVKSPGLLRGLRSLLRRRLLGGGGSQTDEVLDELQWAEDSSGTTLLEYNVGGFKVTLVDMGSEVVYLAKPRIEAQLISLMRSRLNDVLLLMRRGNDVGEVLRAVLGIRPEEVPHAIYALKTLVGYGKLQVLLDDPHIDDIVIEGPGPVWVRHKYVEANYPEVDLIRTNIVFKGVEEILRLQQSIALRCGVYISPSNPILDIQLPQDDGGHRVHMVLHTISVTNRPEIVVRKRLGVPPHIEEWVKSFALPRAVADLLRLLLHVRGSLIIAGPPGSGKTTLLRSLLWYCVPRNWKVVVIEDTGEIDPPPGAPWTRYVTFELGNVRVGLFDLAKASLRASGTKLMVVGETRGAETQVLTQAMLSGLGGLCLPRDQLVLARVDGKIDLYEIGDLVEGALNGKYKKIEVVTLSPEGNAIWAPVARTFVRSGSNRFVRVIVAGGASHEVHEDHLVVVFSDGILATKPARELKPGDLLLSLPLPEIEDGGAEGSARRAALEPKVSALLGRLVGLAVVSGVVVREGSGWVALRAQRDVASRIYRVIRDMGLEEQAIELRSKGDGTEEIIVKSQALQDAVASLLQLDSEGRVVYLNVQRLLSMPKDFARGLLRGVIDCAEKAPEALRSRDNVGPAIVLPSRKLAECLALILRSIGVLASVKPLTDKRRGEETYLVEALRIPPASLRIQLGSTRGAPAQRLIDVPANRLVLLPVVSVEIVEKASLLYDLEVPGTHLYAISGSLVVTHNSTFHGSTPEEVVARLMAPPISLTPSQVAMFNLVAVMGFGERPRRQLKVLAEPLYDAGSGTVKINEVWRRDLDGLDVTLEELLRRLKRLGELARRGEEPLEVVLRRLTPPNGGGEGINR